MSIKIASFQYLPWFSAQFTSMMDRFDQQAFPQSLLLVGEKDIGKSIFANDLAKSILCLNRTTDKACGNCQSCIWIEKNSHPDLLVIESEEKSTVIKVDQIRQLIQFSQITSETGKKIIIIHDADEMNLNAANALLKTLEEPTNNCYLILVTSYPKKLPITIVSRCQRQLMSVDGQVDIIQKWLAGLGSSYESSQLIKILSISYGRPILSYQLLEKDVLSIINDLESQMMRYLQHKNNLDDLTNFIVKNWHIASHVILYWLVEALRGNQEHNIAQSLGNMSYIAQYENYERFVKVIELAATNVKQEWLIQEWIVKLTS